MLRDGMSCDATWLIREISRVFFAVWLSRGATYSLQVSRIYNLQRESMENDGKMSCKVKNEQT